MSSSVASNETRNLIAASKVNGTAVFNRAGENIGSIYDVMINKLNGQVAYAVLGFGGFLGIGEDYYPLPWKSMAYDIALGGYVTDVTPAQLQGAPHHARDDASAWDDPAYIRRIGDYYGAGGI